MPLILPVISRPLMRVRPRLFSTSRVPRHRAYPHAPNRGSPRPNILFSLHTHTYMHTYTPALPLFFLSISISTRTQLDERRGASARARLHEERARGVHTRVELDEARGKEVVRGEQQPGIFLPSSSPSYHRRIQKCRREFCIMHGPRSAELPA